MIESQFTAEPGKQDTLMTTILDATPHEVFRVFLDPAAIPSWWGPAYLTTVVNFLEVKPGGLWRHVQTDPDGSVYGFHGVYHEVIPDHRITFTFEFEGEPGKIILETVRFEPVEGEKTRLWDHSVFQTVEDRDGMLQSGMEGGARESMQRFALLLKH